MKTTRLFGIALLTVLINVGFSACGGSDDNDDNGGSNVSASFEGEWHVTTLKRYEWDASKNAPNLSNVTKEKTFGTTSDFETWVITKKDNGNILVKLMTDNDAKYHYNGTVIVQETEYIHLSGNEYYKEKKGTVTDRLIFKTISSNQLTVEYIEYYDNNVDYWIYTFTK